MGRTLTTLALLGVFTATSGFTAPKSTLRTAQQQQQQRHALVVSISQTRATQPHNNEFRPLIATRMTKDDSLSEGEKTEQIADSIDEAAAVASTDTSTKSKSPSNTGFSLLLIPTLLFKFAIVMLIKFATDVVVFPTLFMYRIARLGKRKFMRGLRRLFGREEDVSGVKVNGDSSSS